MTKRDRALDELTRLLGQCLGRIDEHAFALQRGEEDPDEAHEALERETGRLQELLDALLRSAESGDPARTDLNRTVERVVRETLPELPFPIVLRQQLAADLPPVACSPGELACAVQRALLLGTAHARTRGEVEIATRLDGDGVVFELEATGTKDKNLKERAATLREFVAGCQGKCTLDLDSRGALLLAIELPAAMAPGQR